MNDSLTSRRTHTTLWLLGAAFFALSIWSAMPASAASTIYYCPHRKADQQYSAKPAADCVPLVQKKDAVADQERDWFAQEKPKKEFKIDNLQNDVSEFLGKYREFLACCKTDLTELRQIQELGDDVNELLTATQAQISNHSLASRGIMLREMIPSVAKARADLKTLRATLERIGTTMNNREAGDAEQSARETQTLRELEESLERDFVAPQQPKGPKTGTAIGVAPLAGPSIGKSSKTGSVIGREGATGQEIGASPRSSGEIGGSGPTGFAIGATGRAGPDIGESVFNSDSSSNVGSSLQRSTVGSSLSDSTVGSNLGTSTVGSSLQDTSVGSSFGGSAVGSSLQDR